MKPSRRSMLKILGGGAVIAACGAGTFIATRAPSRALEPWEKAGIGYADPRMHALSWAILAPNPHNRQPWVVRLDGDTEFTLFAEPARKLPHTDPFDRQITIGLGCFLETARQAAAERGFGLELMAFPEGESGARLDGRPVARARLVENGAKPDPLFRHVLQRRSCKEPFDMAKPVAKASLETLRATASPGVKVDGTVEPAATAELRDLGWRAHVVEAQTPDTYMESVDLMRFGKTEIESNPDGIDLGGPFLEALQLAGVLSREKLADMSSEAYRQGMDMYRAIFDNTPAFVWMSTQGNTRHEQLEAGASWVRLNLGATAMGLSVHPVSQALQEYVEMAPLLERAHTQLGAAPGERVQMLARLGYGPSIAPSPRWALETRIRAT